MGRDTNRFVEFLVENNAVVVSSPVWIFLLDFACLQKLCTESLQLQVLCAESQKFPPIVTDAVLHLQLSQCRLVLREKQTRCECVQRPVECWGRSIENSQGEHLSTCVAADLGRYCEAVRLEISRCTSPNRWMYAYQPIGTDAYRCLACNVAYLGVCDEKHALNGSKVAYCNRIDACTYPC